MEQITKQQIGLIWQRKLLILLVAMSFLFVMFYGTVESMVQIWQRSETFTHGFLILPISIYLIWINKRKLSLVEPVTEYRIIPFMVLVSFAWLLASLVDVQVVMQLAFVALMILTIFLLLGWSVVRLILFPLMYLFFAVPIGEQLITPMMYLTADFVIAAIELTGIPIYSEGTFFTLPSGSWSVVEGCSGVRYLIASIALGTLYAYLNYNRYWKRMVFIIAAILFPIVANWLRAFLIVMLGHFSDMKLATGVDHLIYGWVFFGVVLFIMFWIGSYWRDDELPETEADDVIIKNESINKSMLVTLAGLLVAASGPLLDYKISQESNLGAETIQNLPFEIKGNQFWQQANKNLIKWEPQYIKPTASLQSEFSAKLSKSSNQPSVNKSRTGLYIAWYETQKQDAELINSQNIMIRQKHPIWRQISEDVQKIDINGRAVDIIETHLNSQTQDLLIWHWNVISEQVVINNYKAKLIEALAKISGNQSGEYAVVVYTEVQPSNKQRSRKTLQNFVNSMHQEISDTLTSLDKMKDDR